MFANSPQTSPLTAAGLGGSTTSAEAKPVPLRNGGLALGLLIFAGVCARLLLFVLGPMGALELAAAPSTALDASIGLAVAEEVSLDPFATQAELYAPGEENPPLRLPGYPLLIAGVHALGLPLSALLLLQVAMGAAATWLAYRVAEGLLASRRCSLAVAAIVALHPASMVASITLAPDTLFMVLLLAGLALVTARERHDFAGSLVGGLCIGVAILVKPVTILLGAAIGVWMIISGRRLSSITAGAVFAVASIAPVAAWGAWGHLATLGWWPHETSPFTGAPADLAWNDPTAMMSAAQQHFGPFFASHDLSGLYARLGISAPEGVAPVLLLPLIEPARLLAVRDASMVLALGWTAINALLIVGMVTGAIMLLLRGRLTALLLTLGLCSYFLLTWDGEQAEAARLSVLALQAVLVSAVALPGLAAALAERRRKAAERRRLHPEPEPQPEPVVLRTGRPL